MLLKLTLVPNRATGPRRGIRFVVYRREADGRVQPYRYEERGAEHSCEPVRYRDIARDYAADPEFARAWREHVEAQEAA